MTHLIDELERLEKAATPGPWLRSDRFGSGGVGGWDGCEVEAPCTCTRCASGESTGHEPQCLWDGFRETCRRSDAELIAFLRNNSRTFAAAMRDREKMREALEEIAEIDGASPTEPGGACGKVARAALSPAQEQPDGLES